MDEFLKAMEEMDYQQGSYLETFMRNRSYDGQPQTDQGERGKQIVSGITMRDIHDACIRAFYHASGLSKEDYPRTVFELDLSNLDPVAVAQNLTCGIEKMMGIYPNVPKLTYIDET